MKGPHGLQDILAPHLRVLDAGLMVSFHRQSCEATRCRDHRVREHTALA